MTKIKHLGKRTLVALLPAVAVLGLVSPASATTKHLGNQVRTGVCYSRAHLTTSTSGGHKYVTGYGMDTSCGTPLSQHYNFSLNGGYYFGGSRYSASWAVGTTIVYSSSAQFCIQFTDYGWVQSCVKVS